jgi:hypothetical protein
MFDCHSTSMEPLPNAADPSDRRDAPRVDIGGRYNIRLDPCDGRGPITCVLLDFSVTGMRLQLPDDAVLPTEVTVLIGELSHNARIVWREGIVAGVDFIDEHHSIF